MILQPACPGPCVQVSAVIHLFGLNQYEMAFNTLLSAKGCTSILITIRLTVERIFGSVLFEASVSLTQETLTWSARFKLQRFRLALRLRKTCRALYPTSIYYGRPHLCLTKKFRPFRIHNRKANTPKKTPNTSGRRMLSKIWVIHSDNVPGIIIRLPFPETLTTCPD